MTIKTDRPVTLNLNYNVYLLLAETKYKLFGMNFSFKESQPETF